jgi:translation elongation factor EF-1alpha
MTIKQFESNGVTSYDRVLEELKNLGKAPSFYSPKHHIFLTDDDKTLSQTDAILLVVGTTDILGPTSWLDDLENYHSLMKENKIAVAINMSDSEDWSQTVFTAIQSKLIRQFNTFAIDISRYESKSYANNSNCKCRTPIIPVSLISGDNLLEKSSKTPWFFTSSTSGITLVTALDRALS